MKKIRGGVAHKYSLGSCSENFTPQEKSIVIEDNQAKNDGETKIQTRQQSLIFDEATAYLKWRDSEAISFVIFSSGALFKSRGVLEDSALLQPELLDDSNLLVLFTAALPSQNLALNGHSRNTSVNECMNE